MGPKLIQIKIICKAHQLVHIDTKTPKQLIHTYASDKFASMKSINYNTNDNINLTF